MTFRLGNLGGQRLVYDPQVGAVQGTELIAQRKLSPKATKSQTLNKQIDPQSFSK